MNDKQTIPSEKSMRGDYDAHGGDGDAWYTSGFIVKPWVIKPDHGVNAHIKGVGEV